MEPKPAGPVPRAFLFVPGGAAACRCFPASSPPCRLQTGPGGAVVLRLTPSPGTAVNTPSPRFSPPLLFSHGPAAQRRAAGRRRGRAQRLRPAPAQPPASPPGPANPARIPARAHRPHAVLEAQGRGDLLYECQAVKRAPYEYAWLLLSPGMKAHKTAAATPSPTTPAPARAGCTATVPASARKNSSKPPARQNLPLLRAMVGPSDTRARSPTSATSRPAAPWAAWSPTRPAPPPPWACASPCPTKPTTSSGAPPTELSSHPRKSPHEAGFLLAGRVA
jgi:hypothetical protein